MVENNPQYEPGKVKESSESLDDRGFQIEHFDYEGRDISIVSIEHEPKYFNNPDLIPPDWEEQISDELKDASVVFTEYFVPDIMNQLPGIPPLDSYIKDYTERRVKPVYGRLEEMAKEANVPIATAEIGASYPYAFYELMTQAPRRVSIMAKNWRVLNDESKILPLLNSGSFGVEATDKEYHFPYSVNMRRLLTSEAMKQEAKRHREGSKLVLVTAPAHANRIKEHFDKQLDFKRKLNIEIGKKLPGLNSSIRIYKPFKDGDGWIRTASIPIK